MDSNHQEDYSRSGGYRSHHYTQGSSTYDDHRRPQLFSHGESHQMPNRENLTGNANFRPQPYRATIAHEAPFDRQDVSLQEQQFDHQFDYSVDTQRESANSTHQVTAIHTLNPTRCQMPHHNSYHGDISGQEAEQILKASPKRNCYLTRYSNNSSTYTLSVMYVYNNQDKVGHYKLSIDSERYTLEGTEKTFTTLDELLKYYESNPLSPEIRNLGSPCFPLVIQRNKSSHSISQESSLPPDGSINVLEAFTKLNEAHMKQLNEQRKYFDEKLEKEQEKVKEILENQRRIDEQRQKDMQKLLETLQQQKESERQKKLEEERKEEEEKRFLELKQEMEQQQKKFEEELKKKKGSCTVS